jgi:hypothetical protein
MWNSTEPFSKSKVIDRLARFRTSIRTVSIDIMMRWSSRADRLCCCPAISRSARNAAVMATLIMTAKLNGIDPQAWLADVLARIASLPQGRLHELLPWNWSAHVRSVAPPQAA